MKLSTRLAVSASALVAAVALTTLAGSSAALAATPIPIPPITKLIVPQLKLTLNDAQIEPSTNEWWTLWGHYSDNSPLSGTILISRDLHNGTPVQLLYSTTSTNQFVNGSGYPMPSIPVGGATVTATFTPFGGGLGGGASASASYIVRLGGASVSATPSSATAGSSTPVALTVSVPSTDAGYALGGRIGLQVDALGEKANCIPITMTPTTASCTATLPGSLSAGKHALTAIWTNSPSFETATYASTFMIAPAKKSSGSSGSSGSTGSTSAAASAPATPPATAGAAPTATADALPAGSGPTPTDADTSPAASTFPLWEILVVAIVVLVLLGAGVFVAVGVVRSRRPRAA